MTYPTIYIVTPCYNASRTIDDTILSVITQSGDFVIKYHIQDGKSTDGTLDIIKKWWAKIELNSIPIRCKGIELTFSSEQDKGLYDALERGFNMFQKASPNDFFTWINADDRLNQGTCAMIAKFFHTYDSIHYSWVTGVTNVIDDALHFTSHLMTYYPQEVISSGLCDGEYWPFIQQEGTFFKKWLWEKAIEQKAFEKLNYAGDWNLWRIMSQYASLIKYNYPLATFVKHKDQITANKFKEYYSETLSLVCKKSRINSLKNLYKNKESIIAKSIVNKKMNKKTLMNIVDVKVENLLEFYYNRLDT